MRSTVKATLWKLRPALVAWPLALAGALAGTGALAQREYDPKLFAMLPPYCKYTQVYQQTVPGGNDLTQIERWKTIMGPTTSSTCTTTAGGWRT